MFNPDIIYYGLSVIMLLLFIYTILIGFSLRKRIIDYLPRKRASGIILFALGATITLLSGIILLLVDRDRIITDLQYQMLQYSIFYVSMGLILFGTDSVTIAARNPGSTDALIWNRLRIGIGILFIVSIIIACSFLFNPGTYTITQVGSRTIAAQQQVFFSSAHFCFGSKRHHTGNSLSQCKECKNKRSFNLVCLGFDVRFNRAY